MVKEGDKAQIDWIFPDGGLTFFVCIVTKKNQL